MNKHLENGGLGDWSVWSVYKTLCELSFFSTVIILTPSSSSIVLHLILLLATTWQFHFSYTA